MNRAVDELLCLDGPVQMARADDPRAGRGRRLPIAGGHIAALGVCGKWRPVRLPRTAVRGPGCLPNPHLAFRGGPHSASGHHWPASNRASRCAYCAAIPRTRAWPARATPSQLHHSGTRGTAADLVMTTVDHVMMLVGGGDGNRTRARGFAGPCRTTGYAAGTGERTSLLRLRRTGRGATISRPADEKRSRQKRSERVGRT